MRAGRIAGQALVVALAFAALLAGGSLLVFSLGQTVNDKLRLQNAADAAAYSAALWEARSLNFQAYTNRAIVANEVAIAQFVSLRSWSSYVGRTLDNASLVTSWLPPVGRALAAVAQGWRGVDRTLQSSLPAAEAAISHWNVDALTIAQSVMHQQALIGAADLVTEVAAANEPRAVVSSATRLFEARNASTWQNGLTARYRRGGGELQRFGELLQSARDGFSATRRAELLPSNPFVDIRKRGGTDLVGEYVWRGMDTLALHVDLLFGSSEVPIGWGAAEERRLAVRTRGVHGGSWRDNPRTSRLADRAMLAREGYAGLPEIRDVIQPRRQQDLRLRYSVGLSLPQERIRTADREMTSGIGLPDGSTFDLQPSLSGGGLHALSTAEIFFRRPVPRADRRREFPSLFNPYWQAHLVAVDAPVRLLSAPSRGLDVDPYAVLP
jgi:hypothetical protein